jgi:hypothetical protein
MPARRDRWLGVGSRSESPFVSCAEEMRVDDGRRGEGTAEWGSSRRNRVRSPAEWKLTPDLLGVMVGRERNKYLIPSLVSRPISISIGSTSTASLPLRNLEDATSCLAATSGFKLDTNSTVTEQHETDRTWGTITQDEGFEMDKIGWDALEYTIYYTSVRLSVVSVPSPRLWTGGRLRIGPSIKAFRLGLVAVFIPGPGGREVPGIDFPRSGSRGVPHSVRTHK